MLTSRRRFLAGSAMVAATAPLAPLFASPPPLELRAEPGFVDLGVAGQSETPIWGYGGGAPGPTIRVKQGDRVRRRFVNGLPQPSTVHWHGVRIENAMDGVPELTQNVVAPGADFLYDFAVPDAGTYWYHPHNRTWEQLARGLYGALIVEEPEPPAVDRDEALLIDDWRIDDNGLIDEQSLGSLRDWSHGGRLGNWVTVSGEGDYRRSVRRHERLRLRLINVANARTFDLGFTGMNGWLAALDGQPLARSEPFESVELAPAQRADVIADVTASDAAHLYAVAGDERIAIGAFEVAGEARDRTLAEPPPLPANPAPEPAGLVDARRVPLVMEGGAMGGLQTALYRGEPMGVRDLAGKGKVWAFNGRVDMPKTPLVEARRGETVRIAMENRTAWPHAMHLHGHHFRQVLGGAAAGPLRDTVLVDANEAVEIAFAADNPGDWLLHCHMVEHSVAGMMTWVRVVG